MSDSPSTSLWGTQLCGGPWRLWCHAPHPRGQGPFQVLTARLVPRFRQAEQEMLQAEAMRELSGYCGVNAGG